MQKGRGWRWGKVGHRNPWVQAIVPSRYLSVGWREHRVSMAVSGEASKEVTLDPNPKG